MEVKQKLFFEIKYHWFRLCSSNSTAGQSSIISYINIQIPNS